MNVSLTLEQRVYRRILPVPTWGLLNHAVDEPVESEWHPNTRCGDSDYEYQHPSWWSQVGGYLLSETPDMAMVLRKSPVALTVVGEMKVPQLSHGRRQVCFLCPHPGHGCLNNCHFGNQNHRRDWDEGTQKKRNTSETRGRRAACQWFEPETSQPTIQAAAAGIEWAIVHTMRTIGQIVNESLLNLLKALTMNIPGVSYW